MKVYLLGGQGRFDNSSGEGVSTYMYEIYRGLKSNKGIKASKIEYPIRDRTGGAYSWFRMAVIASFSDYSHADIIHKVDVKPINPVRKGAAKIVSTAHDFQPLLEPALDSDMSTSLKGRIRLALETRYSLRLMLKSDYLLANSTLTKNDAVKLGFEGSRTFVINHGIDKAYMSNMPRKKAGKKYVVGYIGAFRSRKNVGFAIRAFKMTSQKNLEFRLWGNKRYEYEKLESAASDDKRIYFMGFAPAQKIVETYDSFDAFVFPSLYEGMGYEILEAKARGLPVIIYKHAKIPEEVRRYCIEVKDEGAMADAIENLCSNGPDDSIISKAMRDARNFTWEKTVSKTIEAYEEICEA
jgi:glycosyltransferase involved in cell wall biosynthesis